MNDDNLPSPAPEENKKLISSFMKTTSSSREEATSFLETHQWDLNAAVSAFTEHNVSDDTAESTSLFRRKRRKKENIREETSLAMNDDNLPSPATEINEKLISSFIKNTSSSREEATSFLETHRWDLNAAVSAFTEHNVSDATAESTSLSRYSNLRINIPVPSHSISSKYYISSPSGMWLRALSQATLSRDRNPFSRKRAADTPCESEMIKRRELAGNKPALAEVSGGSKDSGSGDNDGGEQSETTIVQEPEKGDDVDDEDTESDVERPVQSSSRTVSAEPQEVITYIITMWRNGYTIDNGVLLHTFNNLEDAAFIQIIEGLESPRDLNTEENQTRHLVKLIWRQDEDFNSSVDDKDKESDVERPVRSSPRIVSAEPHKVVTFTVTMWRNGFTFDNGPLKTLDKPHDATFIEIVEKLESPREFNPPDGETGFRIKLIRRQDEDFNESPNPNTLTPFQGVGGTTAEKDSAATEPQASSESLKTTPQPSMNLVVDPAAPATSD